MVSQISSTTRGKYKRYIGNDAIKIPRSTKYYQNKKLKKIQLLNTSSTIQDSYKTTENAAETNYSLGTRIINLSLDKNLNFFLTTIRFKFKKDDHFDSGHVNLDSYQPDLFIPDAVEKLNASILKIDDYEEKKEIACAVLSSYFYGNLTQKALSAQMELINLLSENKIPKTLEGLLDVLADTNEANMNIIDYDKKWFCINCYDYVLLGNKSQRSCLKCKSRLFYFIN